MSDLNEDYVTDLRAEIVRAICKVSADRQTMAGTGGADTLHIGAAEICQALTILLAEFLEGGPDLATPGDVRRMSEAIARKIRLGIGEIRQLRAATGDAPPRSIVNRPH